MKSAAPPRERALFWTFAIAVIAALLVAVSARLAERFLDAYQAEATDYAIVRVISPDDEPSLARAQTMLNASPGVVRAARMSAARAAQMLRDAGADTAVEDMPALRLIELRLQPGAQTREVAADLSSRLAAAGFNADVLRPPPDRTQVLLRSAPLLVHVGVIVFCLVLALIAGLAARGLAGRRADLIQVMADLGATRAQTARRISDEAGAIGLGAGFLASVIVAAAAIGAILLMIPDASIAALPRMISPIDAAPLGLAPFISAFVASSGARAAADSLYAEAARLA